MTARQRNITALGGLLVLLAAGCVNQQLHQALLLQENRQLEQCWLAAQAQADDLRRENESLRQREQKPDVPTSAGDTAVIPPTLPPIEKSPPPTGKNPPSALPPVWNPEREK